MRGPLRAVGRGAQFCPLGGAALSTLTACFVSLRCARFSSRSPRLKRRPRLPQRKMAPAARRGHEARERCSQRGCVQAESEVGK